MDAGKEKDYTARIKQSLNTIESRQQETQGEALHGLLGDLREAAEQDTRNSALYELLTNQPHLTQTLSEAKHEMTTIASTLTTVLRDKYGINVDKQGYLVLKALPWHYEDLAEELKSLGESDWSSKALWEIERVLKESAPRTAPSGVKETIRVNTNPSSDDFSKAVNAIISDYGISGDEAAETVETVLGALRGAQYAPREETTTE